MWGPRQTGKSTLIRTLYPRARRYDLLLADVYRRLEVINYNTIASECCVSAPTAKGYFQILILPWRDFLDRLWSGAIVPVCSPRVSSASMSQISVSENEAVVRKRTVPIRPAFTDAESLREETPTVRDVESCCTTASTPGSASPASKPSYATWDVSKRMRANNPVAPWMSAPKICIENG